MRSAFRVVMLCAVWATSLAASATDVFVGTSSLAYSRRGHSATLLPNGKVLLTGGIGYNGTYGQSELYSPATGIWSSTGPMAKPRRYHSATLLFNGKVLVAGGFDDYNIPLQAELYDSAAGVWSAAGSLVNARNTHSATLLSNGKVLIVGGKTAADGTGNTYPTRVEVFDPSTATWTSAVALAFGRASHTATLLPNGKVLVAGGTGAGGYFTSSVLYDPVAGTWATTGSLATARSNHTATLLPNGKVLVTGGFNGSYLASTELYNPSTGTWSVSGSMGSARQTTPQPWLAGGKLLIAGGSSSASTFPTATEFYDPAAGTCSAGPTLVSSREMHTATLLPAGEVLLSGGSNKTFTAYLGSAELYGTPTITTPNSSLISITTARIGGIVTKIGSSALIERGVVYAPTVANSAPEIGGALVTTIVTTGTTGAFTVDLSGLQPGTAYSFRAYATNGVGTGYSATGSFTSLTPIEAWRKTWYGVTTSTGNAADDADPYHTGVGNLLVFAFLGPGQNPAHARLSQLPQARWVDGSFGYSFLPPAGIGGLVVSAEQSATLQEDSWQTVPDTGSGGLHRFLLDPAGGQCRFLRLKVTRP